MTEQNKEQAYQQIIESLFDIIAHATLNVGAWPQVDELQARYQKLLAEEPTARPDTPESDDEEEARAEAYWRKSEQQEEEVQE
jgi:hypothetical protein